MSDLRRPAGLFLLVGIVVLVATTGGLAVDTQATVEGVHDAHGGLETPPEDQVADAEAAIEFSQVFSRLTDQPGQYLVRHEYQLPDQLTSYEVTLPVEATVTDRHGFIREDDRTFRWDETTQAPTLTYEMDGNRTVERDDPIAGQGPLLFADTGEWALVTRPALGHSWGWRGERVGLERSASVEGPGVAGEVLSYLGPYDEHTRTTAGQDLRLIEPAAAELAEPPADILDSVGDAADRLRVGARDEDVLMVAAPTAGVQWGVRGLQTGAADLWVRDSEQLADPDNVWLHEYVHTRQDYTLDDDIEWFTEATAVYYAALFTYEQGRIDFETFADRLARGSDDRFADARLDTPATWRSTNANYFTGALVTGELDRQLRSATDGQQTFQSVFTQLNAASEPVTAAQFADFVETTGGTAVREAAIELTTTTDRPQMWDQTTHQSTFDQDPPRFGYEVVSVTVDGVAGTPPTVTATPGATVELTVRVTNHGGATGSYVATVFHDDDAVDTLEGTLEPGESTTRTVTRTVPTTGVFQFGVDTAGLTIEVTEEQPVTDDPQPGFGIGAAVASLTTLALLARRR